MSLVVSCPRCGDEVTLPSEAHDESLVQCPYCAEVYPLGEVRRHLPPALIVLRSPVGPVADPSELDDEQLRLAPLETAPAFVAERTPAERLPASYNLRAPRSQPTRAKRNPLVELTKVVGGGVVGLIIGQLILWWMPGDWHPANRDPAGIGARWGQHVPWIVPAQVRGMPTTTDPLDGPRLAATPPVQPNLDVNGEDWSRFEQLLPDDSSDEDDMLPPPLVDGRGVPTAEDGMTDESADADLADRDDAERDEDGQVGADDRRDAEQVLSGDDDASDTQSPPSLGSRDAASPPGGQRSEDSNAAGPGDSRPANSARSIGFRRAPRYDSAQLMHVIDQLKFTLDEWSEERQEASAEAVHEALGQAAMVVPFTDPTQEETRSAARELRGLLQRIARDDSKLAAIARLGTDPPLASRTAQEGILVTGRVDSMETRGKLFSTIVLQDDGTKLEVLSTVNPEGRLVPGARTVVLGIVIHDPVEELEGYAGPEHPMLYGSLAITVVR